MTTERILITFNKDGTFRGASNYGWDGMPAPLDVAALKALFPQLNAAAVAKVATVEAELQAEKSAKDEALAAVTTERDQLLALKSDMEGKVRNALATGDTSQFVAVATDFLTPAEAKIRARKLAEYEALKAELGL